MPNWQTFEFPISISNAFSRTKVACPADTCRPYWPILRFDVSLLFRMPGRLQNARDAWTQIRKLCKKVGDSIRWLRAGWRMFDICGNYNYCCIFPLIGRSRVVFSRKCNDFRRWRYIALGKEKDFHLIDSQFYLDWIVCNFPRKQNLYNTHFLIGIQLMQWKSTDLFSRNQYILSPAVL